MEWITVGIWFGLAAFNYFFADKPEIEDAKAASLSELGIPRVLEGEPVPLLYGRNRLRKSAIIWYGDLIAKPLESDGMVVAYRYSLGITYGLGICDTGFSRSLTKIWVEDVVVWTGTITADDALLSYDEPGLWGGRLKGGGVAGTINFHPGTFTQDIDDYLDSTDYTGVPGGGPGPGITPADVPAYRGLAYLQYRLMGIGEQPHLPAHSFEFTNWHNHYGYGPVGSDGDDNPVEVLYDLITKKWGGAGVATATIDATTFGAAASTLDTEGNGISLVVSGETEVDAVVSQILQQIAGVLHQDNSTGTPLIKLKLIRDDYTPGALPLLDESSIEEISDWAVGAWNDTVNTVRLRYTDRAAGYVQRTSVAQDMARATVDGRVKAQTFNYPGVKSASLAAKIATRELKVLSQPIIRARVIANRTASEFAPGDVFRLSWSALGVTQMVMRVIRVDYGTLSDGRVAIDCVRDRFDPAGNTLFTAIDPPLYPGSTTAPSVPDASLVLEAPRWMLSLAQQSNIVDVSTLGAHVAMFASPSTGVENSATVLLSDDAGATYKQEGEPRLLAQSATTAGAMVRTDDPTMTIMTVNSVTDSSVFKTATAAQIRNGRNLCYIDGEFIAYETFADLGGGSFSISTIHRGLLDTVPQDHVTSSKLWFVDVAGPVVVGTKKWLGTETLKVKPLISTGFRDEIESAVTALDLVLNQRASRPYPPANLTGEETATAVFARKDLGVFFEDEILVKFRKRTYPSDTIVLGGDSGDTFPASVAPTFQPRGRIGAGAYLDLGGVLDYSSDDPESDGLWVPLALQPLGAGDVTIVSAENSLVAWQSPTLDLTTILQRQTVRNPHFFRDVIAAYDWATLTGTPIYPTANAMGGLGASFACSNVVSAKISQVVDLREGSPVGKAYAVKWYARNTGAGTDKVRITIHALDSSLSSLGSVNSGLVDPGTTWSYRMDSYGTLPANTEYVRIELEVADSGSGTVPTTEIGSCVGYLKATAEQAGNGHFAAALASWTTVSGTWDTTTGQVTYNLRARGTNGELSQKVALPGTIATGEIMVCDLWRGLDEVNATGKAVFEMLNASNAVVSFVETPDQKEATWIRYRMPIVVPATATQWRVRLVSNHATARCGYDAVEVYGIDA